MALSLPLLDFGFGRTSSDADALADPSAENDMCARGKFAIVISGMGLS